MRSEYEIGPPLEYESISFFASSMKFKAAESPLFSGLFISELHTELLKEKQKNYYDH